MPCSRDPREMVSQAARRIAPMSAVREPAVRHINHNHHKHTTIHNRIHTTLTGDVPWHRPIWPTGTANKRDGKMGKEREREKINTKFLSSRDFVDQKFAIDCYWPTKSQPNGSLSAVHSTTHSLA